MLSTDKNVLITDLDNTLFDWFDNWYHAFCPAIKFFLQECDATEEELLKKIKEIHEKYGTTEYENVFFELKDFERRFKNKHEYLKCCQTATSLRNECKNNNLKLFPDTMETLKTLKNNNMKIIVFTETEASNTAKRVKNLGLDGIIDFLYSPPEKNPLLTPLQKTKHSYFPEQEHYKPNSGNLLKILNDLKLEKECCVYLGDSLIKDIQMAQDAGITDIHAKYGENYKSQDEYEILKKVTFWSKNMVDRESRITTRNIAPLFVLNNSINEILPILNISKEVINA